MTLQTILHDNHLISVTYLISSEGLLADSRSLCPSADKEFPPRLQKYTNKSKYITTAREESCTIGSQFSLLNVKVIKRRKDPKITMGING